MDLSTHIHIFKKRMSESNLCSPRSTTVSVTSGPTMRRTGPTQLDTRLEISDTLR